MILIETSIFTRQIQSILTEDEYFDLQNAIIKDPSIGKVIKGSGGVRKLRWHTSGHGKRGGSRIIYYWHTTKDTILMLLIYRKSEQTDLTQAQIQKLKFIVESELNG
jgi:mRNA-degrading endonuclease RelE of RelBE toxin-antitoxin system